VIISQYEQILEDFEQNNEETREFIDRVANLDNSPKTMYLKIALYYLFERDLEALKWLDAYFEPTVNKLIGRLKLPVKGLSASGAVFDTLQRLMNAGDTLNTFKKFYRNAPSYYMLVYLCYICINEIGIGMLIEFDYEQVKNLESIEEIERTLLRGEYEFDIDNYAILSLIDEHGNWKKALTFKEDAQFRDERLTMQYLEDDTLIDRSNLI
jgi:hypothetical protein